MMKRGVPLLVVVAAFFAGASAAHAQSNPELIYACVQKSSQQVRIVEGAGMCRSTEISLSWNVAGTRGPAGADGDQGPAGPAGPEGPPGTALVFAKRWSDQSNHSCCQWHTAPASEVTASTQGGALLIQMDLSLVNGSHGTCRPLIDGQWAGDFAGEPRPPNDSPFWTEGLMAVGCCGGGWRRWTSNRVYTQVPAGPHTFAVQCATDGGNMQLSGGPFSSWQVFEIKQ